MNLKAIALFSMLLCCYMGALGQFVEEAQKKRILENRDFFLSHNILLGDYTYDNPDLNLALHTALTNRSEQRTLRIVGGYILAGGAAIALIGLLAKPNSKRNSSVISGPFGSSISTGTTESDECILIIGGGITAGCSIPFFIASGNRRKRMERSLNIARDLRKQ